MQVNMICYGLGQDPLNFLVPLPSKSISGYCQDVRQKILGRESCDGLAPYLGRGEGGNNFCHFLPWKVG